MSETKNSELEDSLHRSAGERPRSSLARKVFQDVGAADSRQQISPETTCPPQYRCAHPQLGTRTIVALKNNVYSAVDFFPGTWTCCIAFFSVRLCAAATIAVKSAMGLGSAPGVAPSPCAAQSLASLGLLLPMPPTNRSSGAKGAALPLVPM
mmetsp:Transcript_18274/g.31280  ORF Transcript_18274/g.31280 Transcript_18274/m.31280 type:complete len:152 (-) Transcript_18274:1744-2199(-)